MLVKVIQFISQQLGPSVQQIFSTVVPYAQKVPPYVYITAGKYLSESAKNWYESLDSNSKEKLDATIEWAISDLIGDGVNMITPLPVGDIIKLATRKVFTRLREYQNNYDANAYIKAQLIKKLNPKNYQTIKNKKLKISSIDRNNLKTLNSLYKKVIAT